MNAEAAQALPIKLDIGAGKSRCAPDFQTVDMIAFDGVDHVMDVRQCPWPWDTESVSELRTSHFVEHLTREEWVPFFNESYRVLKFGAVMTVIVPHWSHDCAYGDPTHKSFCSGWMALYLQKSWRDQNAPHCGYTCDFDWATSGTWDPWLEVRNMDTRMFAMQRYVNSMRDLIFTLTKTKR
jgi:hypothetical protein